MPSTYKTPGVYIEEISKFPPSVAQVETAIPAFIGYTEVAKEKVDDDLRFKPKRIVSMLEYETYFGQPQPEENIQVTIDETQDEQGGVLDLTVRAGFNGDRSLHVMYYCMQSYFANGGGPCYIVSVGPYTTLGSAIDPGESDPPTLLFEGLAALEKEDEPTLIVFPESQGATVVNQAGLHNQALDQCAKLQDRFAVMTIPAHGETDNILTLASDFRDRAVGINNLRYGAVYAPNIETTFNYSYGRDDDLNRDERVTIVHNLTVTSNPPATSEGPATGLLSDLKGNQDAYYARAKAAISDMPVVLPPTPAVVGVYARVDETRGVWKAPANVSLDVIKPVLKITSEQQESLNVDTVAGKSINAIRTFTGKGTLIWGARTLAGNDNEWRYVPVRRFFNMAEESIKKATEAFVFEPNDANTWTRVKAMIENFLILQWRAGALAGAKPEQAFYVNVGLNETMTALDILEGRMIVEIGMAVVRPAEFIILRFSHKMQES
ncbi:MAG: phage tail sheath C-terminal domain-containing protein [Cyanobacteria bacterium P01_F01_bin.150]